MGCRCHLGQGTRQPPSSRVRAGPPYMVLIAACFERLSLACLSSEALSHSYVCIQGELVVASMVHYRKGAAVPVRGSWRRGSWRRRSTRSPEDDCLR